MFEEPKTIIVVSKDEMAINQFKKMVESDKEKFDGVKVVTWTEKVWMVNKKAGNIESKIVFLGNVKGTDKLIPVLDEKYSEHGVKYGWAGNQAVIYADMKVLEKQENYDAFYEELEALPVPEMLKKRVSPTKEMIEASDETEEESSDESEESADTEVLSEEAIIEEVEPTAEIVEVVDNKKKKAPIDIKKLGGNLLKNVKGVASKAKTNVTSFAQDTFKDRTLMKRQMLFYGVLKMCENNLSEYIDS